MTPAAEWLARYNHSSVALPDGSIVLMGGLSGGFYKNDVWRSTDQGATWSEWSAGDPHWTAREQHTSVALPDGSIVLMGGRDDDGSKNDVWRLAAVPANVTTQAVSNIGAVTATGNGNITSLGVFNPAKHGVCWNTTGTPNVDDDACDNKGEALATGAFTAAITGLTQGTTYYVRAFATNNAGTSYGGNVTLTTLQTYPVSYNANGANSGTAPANQTKIENQNLTLESNSGNLARTGYTFAGWNTQADGNGTDYAEGTPIQQTRP